MRYWVDYEGQKGFKTLDLYRSRDKEGIELHGTFLRTSAYTYVLRINKPRATPCIVLDLDLQTNLKP